MAPHVLFEEKAAANGASIGVARLNAEKTLNALSLEMIDLLAERMASWAADPDVALVVLEGAGDKAFSAGADLHKVHETMLAHHASAQRDDIRGNAYAAEFFGHEYASTTRSTLIRSRCCAGGTGSSWAAAWG